MTWTDDTHSLEYNPPTTLDYVTPLAQRLLQRIESESKRPGDRVLLLGFSSTMKWVYRILCEKGFPVTLCDWRKDFIGFECGSDVVVDVHNLRLSTADLIILCTDTDSATREAIKLLMGPDLSSIDVIYEAVEFNSPINQQEPFRTIAQTARTRARSMISDEQLFELIQLVGNTQNVDGAVVEFGTYAGGSAAILAEALNHYGVRDLWLYDTFAGIPKSVFGLDYRWHGSFADNSYQEVCAAFADLENVHVVRGNIAETHRNCPEHLSLAYIAADTLESGKMLLPFTWERLSQGGIVSVCDYGSFPHCLPLTVFVDEFFKQVKPKLVFRSPRVGIFAVK